MRPLLALPNAPWVAKKRSKKEAVHADTANQIQPRSKDRIRTWHLLAGKGGVFGGRRGNKPVERTLLRKAAERQSLETPMKHPLVLATACSLLATATAFAQTPNSSQPAPSAQQFVEKVAVSDMFEIQAGQLALAKSPDSDTKPFAEKMVADHQKTSSELKSLVDSGKVKAKLPTALDSTHQKMLDDLKAKNGKDFDQAYDQSQVKAHKDAVMLFDAYSKGGDDPELREWAAKTLPHLREHLSMAEKLK
jgi:putative membrane protein